MSIASGARHALNYVRETSIGTTPASPGMTALRITGCSLGLTRETLNSNEIRSDRQITSIRSGTDGVNGNLDFELSYGEFDPLLEAALCGTWANNELKVGSDVHTFSFERAFENIGQYTRFQGVYVNTFSLSLKPSALVTGQFGLIGLTADFSDAPLNATVIPSQTGEVYDSFTGVIKEGGQEIAIVTGLDLSLNNGITPQYALMRRSAAFIVLGKSTLTGTLTAFFENMNLLDKFLNETATSLEFTLGDGVTNSYTVKLPQVRYTSSDMPTQNEGPISISMQFGGIFDKVTDTNLILTRIKP